MAAGFHDARDLQGIAAGVDPLDDTLLIDDKGGAARKPPLLVQNPVELAHAALKVAEQRELNAKLLGEDPLRRDGINAYGQDLGFFVVEVVDISLISVQFGSSAAGEGQDVKGQDDVLRAQEIRKTDGLAFMAGKLEVGGLVPYLEAIRLGRCQAHKENRGQKENKWFHAVRLYSIPQPCCNC